MVRTKNILSNIDMEGREISPGGYPLADHQSVKRNEGIGRVNIKFFFKL